MKKYKQGFASVAIIIILVLLAAGAVYVLTKDRAETSTVCTLDAKQCPDGSYVSRVGPSCEFAACPAGIGDDGESLVPKETSYRNDQYGFEVGFSPQWRVGSCGENCVGFSDGRSQDWSSVVEIYPNTAYSEVKEKHVSRITRGEMDFLENDSVVNGIKWKKLTVGENTWYLIERNGNTYEVSFGLVGSFKFIN